MLSALTVPRTISQFNLQFSNVDFQFTIFLHLKFNFLLKLGIHDIWVEKNEIGSLLLFRDDTGDSLKGNKSMKKY